MSEPESRTVEEGEEKLVDLWREAGVRGYNAPNSWEADFARVTWFLAAAKEHGLVIGEGELDAAWKEAEAALPERWQMGSLLATVGFDGGIASTVRWRATAYLIYGGYGRDEKENDDATGSTPAAALHALAERLRR